MSKFFLFSGIFLLVILIPLGISSSLSFSSSSLISKINDLPKKKRITKIRELLKYKKSCPTTLIFSEDSKNLFPNIKTKEDLAYAGEGTKNKFSDLESEYQLVMERVQQNYPDFSTRLLYYQDLQYAIFNLKNAQELLAIFLFAPQFAFLRKWKVLEVDSKFFLKWFYNPLLSWLKNDWSLSDFKIGNPAPNIVRHNSDPQEFDSEFEFKCYSRFLFYKLIFVFQDILEMDTKSFFLSPNPADTTIFQQNKQKILVFLQRKIDYHLQLKLKTTKKILADNLLLSLSLYKKKTPDYYLMFFSPPSAKTYNMPTGFLHFQIKIHDFCGNWDKLFGDGFYPAKSFEREALMTTVLCQKAWNNKVYSSQSFGFDRVSFLLFLRNIFAEKNNWLKEANENNFGLTEEPVSFISSKTVKNNQDQDYYDDPFFHEGQSGKQIYILTKKVNDFFFKTYFSPDHNYDQTFAHVFFNGSGKKTLIKSQKSFADFKRGWTQGAYYEIHPKGKQIDSALRGIYSQDLGFLSLNNTILTRINQKLVNLERFWFFFHLSFRKTDSNPEFQSIIKSLAFFKKNSQYLKFFKKNERVSLYNLEKKDLLYFLDFVEAFFQELNVSEETINEINFDLFNSDLFTKLSAYVIQNEFNQIKEENLKKINSNNKTIFYFFIGAFLLTVAIFVFIFFKTKTKTTKNIFKKKRI